MANAKISDITATESTAATDTDLFEGEEAGGTSFKIAFSVIKSTLQTAFGALYAPIAKGVTNGDTHDHAGGDGAQIDHGGLAGLTDDDHTQYTKHSLATAANDFLVASGVGAFVKKTLAETLTILGKGAASGLATLDGSSKVVQDPANATATPTGSKIPIADVSGYLDGWITPASTTVDGLIEVATAAETTTGTDATRAVSPDGLAGSDYGKRVVGILVTDPGGDDLATGDEQAYFRVPSVMNGWNLVAVAAHVSTVSSSGNPTVQIRNVTDTQDMLSTALSIDANEKDSSTAATPAVINATYDDVATGDEIAIDVDTAGTGAKGLYVEMIFQLP